MENTAPDLPQAAIQVTSIGLHAIEFTRLGPKNEFEDLQIRFGLGVIHPAEDTVGVEFDFATEEEDAFRALITYRATFQRMVPFGEDEDREAFWRTVAGQLSTLVLMPYVRATFAWVLSQSGFSSVILPLVNPAQMFKPEDVGVPEAADEGAGEG